MGKNKKNEHEEALKITTKRKERVFCKKDGGAFEKY